MGTKLLWLGLTLVIGGPLTRIPAVVIVGQVIMIVGCALLLLGK